MRGLKDKYVVITGGASGIGRVTVGRFLEEGATVVVFDKNEVACHQLETDFPGLKATIPVDVSDYLSVQEAFQIYDDHYDRLDVLVNNAGISYRHSFLEITPEEWQNVISVNLTGIFYVAQQAARRMLARDGGVILNMGSTNALRGYHYYADYNASKAGVVELTRSMALELGPKIRVNAICPGFILTPMQEAEYTLKMRKEFSDKLPLRKLGTPEDVAALFAFLASDESAFITGESIVIDGGEIVGGLASQA